MTYKLKICGFPWQQAAPYSSFKSFCTKQLTTFGIFPETEVPKWTNFLSSRKQENKIIAHWKEEGSTCYISLFHTFFFVFFLCCLSTLNYLEGTWNKFDNGGESWMLPCFVSSLLLSDDIKHTKLLDNRSKMYFKM